MVLVKPYRPLRYNEQPDPSPQDIARECEIIRAGWSLYEREKRKAYQVQPLGTMMLASSCYHNGDASQDQMIMRIESREQQSAELARA